MTEESELPSLTANQMEVLRRYALLEADVAEVREALAGVFDFNFEARQKNVDGFAQQRMATGRFRLPEPGIVVLREHIANALERKRTGQIDERDLVDWATILLLNDAYVLDPGDEDVIAEWLNDISVHLDAS